MVRKGNEMGNMRKYDCKENNFDNDFCSYGFTLVELLIAIAVFSILSVAIVYVFDRFQRGTTQQQVTIDVIQKTRSALSYVASEIRLAGLDPEASRNFNTTGDPTTNFNVVSATGTTFIYEFDTPPFDGLRYQPTSSADATPDERRLFQFRDNRLEQIDSPGLISPEKPAVALVENVDMNNSRFEYYGPAATQRLGIDAGGNPIAINLQDIRFVKIILALQEPAGRGDNVSRSMDIMVLCRNLQFNAQRRANHE